jgi:hypothetical protein
MKNPRSYLWMMLVSVALLAIGCARLTGGSRTDMQVATDVQNRIHSDSSVPDKQITVNANNGVVTLTGSVSSDTARTAAANDAAQIDGVKTVVNDLQVTSASVMTQPAPQPQAQTQPVANAIANNEAASAPPVRRERPSPRTRSRARAADSNSDSGYTDPGYSAGPSPARGATIAPTASSADNTGTNAPAQQAPAPPDPAPVAPRKIAVPAGTQLSIRLNEEVSSENVQVGDVFHGSLAAPVTIDGETVIPTTADVEGRVVEVKSAGKFAGQSVLTLELTRLTMNGRSYSLQSDQWSKSGNGRGKSTAEKVGGGAAVGAVLGGIFGGGKGAAIGAAAGAGAGTGVSAVGKGQQIVLKPEAVISFTLQNSLTVTPGSARRPMNNQ